MKDRPEFEWSDALKNVFPEEFREKSEAALSGGLVDWFQAFGCELVSKDRRLQPTSFDMTVAAAFSSGCRVPHKGPCDAYEIGRSTAASSAWRAGRAFPPTGAGRTPLAP